MSTFSPPATIASNLMGGSGTDPGNISEVGFDDEVRIVALERFKPLKKDEVARFAFSLFNTRADGSLQPRIKHVLEFSEYHGPNDPDNVRFIAPLHNEQLMKACTNRYGEPRARFACIVLHYDTDAYGTPTQTSGDGYCLEVLTFGADKWNPLKQIHQEWGLQNHDITALCTEANFQRWTMQAARECLWASSPKAKDIQARATELHERHLAAFLGKQRSESEIVSLLNGPRAGMVPVSPFVPVNPFAGEHSPAIGGAPKAASPPPWAPGAAPFADLVAKETQAADPKATAEKDTSKGTAQ